jgi:ParB family transcriptional regulator, chromosome partitioning protein
MTRKVLGRGLDALIPYDPTVEEMETTPDRVHMITLEKIIPNPRQPRRGFDEARLNELSHSIREMGILEPVIVRAAEDGRYELIAGERRFRAAQKAGLKEIPALIREFMGRQTLEVALIENLQREDLNPVDEARAYLRLTEEFGRTHAEISRDVGKDRSTISNLIRLLRLPEEILNEVSRGTLSTGHARVLLALEDSREQVLLAQTMIREGWSVRRAEKYLSRKHQAGDGAASRSAEAAGDQPVDREVVRIEEALRYALGTEVHMHHDGDSGSIEISYASREELERILDLLRVQIH